MSSKKPLLLLSLCLVFCFACVYIVVPADLIATPTLQSVSGWTGMVTGFEETETQGTRIYISLRNSTNDWSAMKAVENEPAILLTSSGSKTECPIVIVGTGKHRVAPGFQIRGFTGGTRKEPEKQLLYVECPVPEIAAGSNLSISYQYIVGAYDLHVPSIEIKKEMLLNLDQVESDLVYPFDDSSMVVVNKMGDKISAINNFSLILTEAMRSDTGLELLWKAENPSDYPNYVHIGEPPVLGNDGIIYGYYVDPSIADATIALPKDESEWTTSVLVPADVTGLYIMVSVETRQSKYFINHVIDISDK